MYESNEIETNEIEIAIAAAEAELDRRRRKVAELEAEAEEVRARFGAYNAEGRPSAALAERERLDQLPNELLIAQAHVTEARVELLTAREPLLDREFNEACEIAYAFEQGELVPARDRHNELINAREHARGLLRDVRMELALAKREAAAAAHVTSAPIVRSLPHSR